MNIEFNNSLLAVCDLEASRRLINLLKRENVDTRMKAIRLCNKPFSKRPYGFGRKSRNELLEILESMKEYENKSSWVPVR